MRSSGEEAQELTVPERSGHADRERAEELVLRLVGSQADSLLRVARRYSLCADDAHDAYQRALEILMRHAARLDPDRAAGWLHTVVKHEALAINRSRRRIVGSADPDLDALEARTSASPEERVIASDRVARSAEALHGLKPQEVRALWLKALGHSYQQICEATGWSYTKVNRSLAEGRKSFLARYALIESGGECDRLAPLLSAFVDGEADAEQALELRRHLRGCPACRAVVRGLHESAQPLTVVFPAAAVAAAGGAEQASGFFVRVYETVTLSLHERAANSFLRAQAIVDTVTAGKMAAAAASAAALAGGGVAVEGVLGGAPPATPQALVRRADHGAATAFVKAPVRTRTHVKHRSHARATRPRHHQKPASAAAATVRASVTTTQQASAPATAATAPPASAASTGAGHSASGEFGFEGP